MELGAKFYDTEFTSVWTGKAEQEIQTISISSDVVYDVQVCQTYMNFNMPFYLLILSFFEKKRPF